MKKHAALSAGQPERDAGFFYLFLSLCGAHIYIKGGGAASASVFLRGGMRGAET